MIKLRVRDHGTCRELLMGPLALGVGGVLVGGAVAGCGFARAPTSTSMADRDRQPTVTRTAMPRHGLCADPAAVDRVVIFRTAMLHVMQPHDPVPPVVSAASGARARALAEAACGLPKLPSGPLSCPAEFFVHYRLRFAAGRRRFAAVTVEPTGCQTVSGLGPVRWASRTPGFWTAFDRVTHGQPPARGR